MHMVIDVLEPKAYCAGVKRAIKIAIDERLSHPDTPVYVLGMLVHNREVTAMLEEKGVHTLFRDGTEDRALIDSIPKGSILVFTAHGHDAGLDAYCLSKGLSIVDACCPKVLANATKVREEVSSGHQVLYIGEARHPECQAILSLSKQVLLVDEKLLDNHYLITDTSPFVINQTTMNIKSIKSLHERILSIWPKARISDETCSATRLRQEAIINLPKGADLIVVVGSLESSNTKRLLEIARESHPEVPSFILETASGFDFSLIKGKRHIVISSGASTPESTIDSVVARLKSLG